MSAFQLQFSSAKMLNIDPTKQVVLLTGADNYEAWAESVTIYLRSQGLWRVVSGASTKPKPNNNIGRITYSTDAVQVEKALERYLKRVEEWESLDEKAHGTICITLSPPIRHEVVNLASSKAVWDHIKEKYNIVSDVQPFEGLQTTINTVYNNCINVQDYVTKLSAALDKFDQSLKKNEKLPESAKIQFLLYNLGYTWDTFLTSYLNSRYDKEKATFSEISQILMQEEMRMRFNS